MARADLTVWQDGGLNADGYQKGSLFSLKTNEPGASFVMVNMAMENEKRKTLERGVFWVDF